MKARILTLDSDEHQAVQALLPWHVNGTLDGSESARVQAHLAQCARCQADAASQQKLRAWPGAAATAGDVERGWAALRSRLDPKPSATRQPRPSAAARGRWATWWPIALGVQAAVVLALALVVFSAMRPVEPYRALGAAPSAAAVANALVVFRADATEAQIRHALRASDARLVGGPTVTDAYLLQLSGLAPQALARLRAQPAVLRVESLEGEGPK